eukprot:1775780-Pleurochrysis_carterae.AAC.1
MGRVGAVARATGVRPKSCEREYYRQDGGGIVIGGWRTQIRLNRDGRNVRVVPRAHSRAV